MKALRNNGNPLRADKGKKPLGGGKRFQKKGKNGGKKNNKPAGEGKSEGKKDPA